ncbi:MAG TPA: hypothetical protein VK849_13785 [Longimicrobiales bacterium]|nr:hypothetical protein [Longimicrobiales bacterium]
MRIAAAALCAGLAGCAASTPLGTGTAPELAAVGSTRGAMHAIVEERVVRDYVPHPVGRVLRALVDVYSALGIEPDWVDAEERVVGRTEVYLRGTLADRPLSDFVSCGRTTVLAQVADESRVKLAVITYVEPEGARGAEIATRVEGVAFPLTAGEGQRRDCTTTSALEARIREGVMEALGGRAGAPSPKANPGPGLSGRVPAGPR